MSAARSCSSTAIRSCSCSVGPDALLIVTSSPTARALVASVTSPAQRIPTAHYIRNPEGAVMGRAWKAAGAAAFLALTVVGCGASVDEKVSEAISVTVSCENAGVMQVAGEARDIYECRRGDERRGCYTVIGDDVYDVSAQAETNGSGVRRIESSADALLGNRFYCTS